MLEFFQPDEYVASVFEIDLENLKEKGIEALIIDIDNTLVSWDTKTADKKLLEWFELLEELEFKVCLLSNNTKDRVVKFTETIRIPAIYRAVKPRKKAFRKAMALMGKTPPVTAIIGDQIFTDIFGGKRFGLYALLVMPINEREFFTTRLVRRLERKILENLMLRGKLVKPCINKEKKQNSSKAKKDL